MDFSELSVTSAACLLGAIPSLTPVYVVCLIVGGGLLVISTVFGGDHDVDTGGVDADVHLDVHADVHADLDAGVDPHVDFHPETDVHAETATDATSHTDHALSIASWFSIRFVVYFAAMFGLTGTVMSFMTEASKGITLVVSVIGGVVVGQGVHQTMRALRRTSGDSSVTAGDFVDKEARVTVAIKPPARGEVAVRVGDAERFLPAVAGRTDDTFASGERVVITSYSAGTAEVVSLEEHEFVSQPDERRQA